MLHATVTAGETGAKQNFGLDFLVKRTSVFCQPRAHVRRTF